MEDRRAQGPALIFSRLVAAALIAIAALPVVAAAQEPVSITVIERGIYTLETTNVHRTPSGIESGTASNICRLAATGTIPAVLDARFGIRYRVIGASEERPVIVRRVIRFPGLMKPLGGPRAVSSFEVLSAANSDKVTYWGYGLDHAWEILPGTWIFEFWHEDRKLAEVSFTLVEGLKRPEEKSEDCFQLSSSL